MWDELAPVCVAMGTLTPADLRPFGTMCELQATMQGVALQKDGGSFHEVRWEPRDDNDDGSGRPEVVAVIDAVLKLERETAIALRPYYALFGLDPVSRTRIQVPKKADAPKSKWEGALK